MLSVHFLLGTHTWAEFWKALTLRFMSVSGERNVFVEKPWIHIARWKKVKERQNSWNMVGRLWEQGWPIDWYISLLWPWDIHIKYHLEKAALRVTVSPTVDQYFSRNALWGTKIFPVLPFPFFSVSVAAWSNQLWEGELEKWDKVHNSINWISLTLSVILWEIKGNPSYSLPSWATGDAAMTWWRLLNRTFC